MNFVFPSVELTCTAPWLAQCRDLYIVCGLHHCPWGSITVRGMYSIGPDMVMVPFPSAPTW